MWPMTSQKILEVRCQKPVEFDVVQGDLGHNIHIEYTHLSLIGNFEVRYGTLHGTRCQIEARVEPLFGMSYDHKVTLFLSRGLTRPLGHPRESRVSGLC